MRSNYNFDADLPLGEQAQAQAIELVRRRFAGLADIRPCRTKEYDFGGTLDGREIKFEVKWDRRAGETGNVAIEFESRGRPSGLSVSAADYYIYKIGEQGFYLFETAALKQKLSDRRNVERIVSGGDPGSNTRMYLVRVRKFVAWGEELK